MSEKRNCKRNVCKRKNDFCDFKDGRGFKKDCGFKDGFYNYDGFKDGYNLGEGGWNNKYGYDNYPCDFKKCDNEERKANHKDFNDACHRENERACDERKCISKHAKCETDAHKLDKEFEDKHRRCDRKACKELDNVCNANHSRKNKKYLVDKLYIYEHHRVIDLDCCENDRRHNEAHKDFKDLECAIEDFKEADFSVKDFCDENRKDFETYENARNKTRDLQSQKKCGNEAFVWQK